MVMVEVDLSKVSGDSEIKFQTFLNYLRQFNEYIDQEYGSGPALAESLWKNLSGIQGAKSFDLNYLSRALRLAWNTETIGCCFGLEEVEALKINNHWKPIQVYYAVYSGSEAVAHLLTNKTKFSHKATLKCVSDFYVKSKIFPWGYGFKGKVGRNGKQAVGVNFPKDTRFGHNLKTWNADPIEVLATCIQAEHKKRVADLFEERKNKKKKGQKIPFKYETDPGLTTLFYFAYRLRLRSNYKSADIFHSNVSESNILDFDGFLNKFCARTLCAFEVLIMRKIGKRNFLAVYDEFKQKVKYNKQLENRMQTSINHSPSRD
jgi:hypothetical protein